MKFLQKTFEFFFLKNLKETSCCISFFLERFRGFLFVFFPQKKQQHNFRANVRISKD